jgi:RNA polymerase sigma factor (sigma-70 family)
MQSFKDSIFASSAAASLGVALRKAMRSDPLRTVEIARILGAEARSFDELVDHLVDRKLARRLSGFLHAIEVADLALVPIKGEPAVGDETDFIADEIRRTYERVLRDVSRERFGRMDPSGTAAIVDHLQQRNGSLHRLLSACLHFGIVPVLVPQRLADDFAELWEDTSPGGFAATDSVMDPSWVQAVLESTDQLKARSSLRHTCSSKRRSAGRLALEEASRRKDSDTFWAPDLVLEEKERAAVLNLALRALPQQQADVVRLLYGMQRPREMSQDEAALHLGITASRVSQISIAAHNKLAKLCWKMGVGPIEFPRDPPFPSIPVVMPVEPIAAAKTRPVAVVRPKKLPADNLASIRAAVDRKGPARSIRPPRSLPEKSVAAKRIPSEASSPPRSIPIPRAKPAPQSIGQNRKPKPMRIGPAVQADHLLRPMDVPGALGASRATANALMEKGILRPRDGEGASGRYSRKDVLALLSELSARARTMRRGGAHHTTLAKAAKLVLCDEVKILRLVLSGELAQCIKIDTHHGYDGVLVDVDELRLATFEPTRRLGVAAIAELLRVSPATIRMLMVDRAFQASGATDKAVDLASLTVSAQAVRAFHTNYVAAEALSPFGGPLHFIVRTFKEHSVPNVFDPEKFGARFYPRAAVAALRLGLV